MLKGVPAILSPELLKVLCEMGHGDRICIGDGNFPGRATAQQGGCVFLRADGHGVPELLDAILQVMPLDAYVETPVMLMERMKCDLDTTEMVKTMNRDAIVFACANPTPEIFPEDAKAGGAKVVSTGRSDYPNQINNVLAFPGIFRGAFDVRAGDINEEMKVAAAHALAELISDEELSEDYIIPKAFDHRVGPAVAKAVAEAARRTGVAYAAAAHRTIL